MALDPETRRAAAAFEKEWAKRVGGRVVPASGSQWWAKQDVDDGEILWSLKLTTKASFSLTQKVLDNISGDTWRPGRAMVTPAIGIRIGSPEYDVVVLRYEDFVALTQPDRKPE